MTIGIFTQFDEPFRAVADITVPVMREYANRHGYVLNVAENRPIERSIVWDRYKILAEAIAEYDWVVHMDADVLITNLHIRLEEFLRKNAVVSFCKTESGQSRVNDGVAMFRNCHEMRGLLKEAFSAHQTDTIRCGQDYIEEQFSVINYDVHVERHKAINAFMYPEYGMPSTTVGNWTPGDFVLHLPGRSNERRVEIFNKITPQILR